MAAIRLKGHEKFHLREGWITKGLYGVSKNPKIFTGNEGTDQLGVGTNMVKSIKYWMLAMGLIGEEQRNGAELTELGKMILEYDAFLEDDLSLWLLHSFIAKNAFRSTVWYLFFNKCQAEEFTKEELFAVLKKELIAYAETDSFPESSLRDDIDVMLNMYSKDIVNDDPEDKNKCPLASLKLIRKEHDVYCRQQPDMRHFRDEIILYELGQIFEKESSVSIDDVAELAANIYHLSRVAVNSILDRLDNAGYITVNRTAGLDEIYPNTASEKAKEYEVKIAENRDSEKYAQERARLKNKITSLEQSKVSSTAGVIDTFNRKGASWMATKMIHDALKELADADKLDTGIPDIHARTIQFLINRKTCLCGTPIEFGGPAYTELNKVLDYIPPKSIHY